MLLAGRSGRAAAPRGSDVIQLYLIVSHVKQFPFPCCCLGDTDIHICICIDTEQCTYFLDGHSRE